MILLKIRFRLYVEIVQIDKLTRRLVEKLYIWLQLSAVIKVIGNFLWVVCLTEQQI